MKATHTCPKCAHNRILFVAMVADAAHGEPPGPARLALIGRRHWDKSDTAGDLSAMMCRRCGYTELYVKDPDSIPVDGKYVRELSGPQPSPYR